MRDYYEILGVERNADADDVKRAYRKLALQYHPDRNGGSPEAEERFKEATEAYEVLRDPEKRAAYDRFGHAGVKGAGAGSQGGFGGVDFADALEIFMRDFGGFGLDDLFGGGARRQRGRQQQRGSDIRVPLRLTLKEVVTGARKSVKVRRDDLCGDCKGSGAAEGASPVRCSTCGGAGEVRRVQQSFLGQMVSVAPCPSCGGAGMTIEEPCNNCAGRGTVAGEHTVEVEIPAGVSTGNYLSLRGQGSAGQRGAGRGDLVILIEVEEDSRFHREGADILYELPVTFTQAALGAEVEVPTVEGKARLKVPRGTQSGRLLRMRGRGLPRLNEGGRGDQIVQVSVWTPTSLSQEQEAALKELREVESSPDPAGTEKRGFWSKVKETFSA